MLLPGAGLARLCCEVAGAGFEAQGNEFAYFMLVASSFVLNAIQERDQLSALAPPPSLPGTFTKWCRGALAAR